MRSAVFLLCLLVGRLEGKKLRQHSRRASDRREPDYERLWESYESIIRGMQETLSLRTMEPTSVPTTSIPTSMPTVIPTRAPTLTPSAAPTVVPTVSPTSMPTTSLPTTRPTSLPTTSPTESPIDSPTTSPTTAAPSIPPTEGPTSVPVNAPTNIPTTIPTRSPSGQPTTPSPTDPLVSIADVLARTPEFSTLTEALVRANLLNLFNSTTQLTLFGPDNDAFDMLGSFGDDLLTNDGFMAHLFQLLAHHSALTRIDTSLLIDNRTIITLLNTPSLTVSNQPPDIFLRTTSGSPLVRISQGDIPASNGVIHELEGVVLPEFAQRNLVDLLEMRDGNFTTLIMLLELAELTETLETQSLMLLAPTNEAFDKLPSETLTHLQNNVDDLRQVLLYHVTPTIRSSLQLQEVDELVMVQGSTVSVTAVFQNTTEVLDAIFFNFVRAQALNGLARNGIIHDLGEVLFPPNVNIPGVFSFNMAAVTDYLHFMNQLKSN